MQKLQMVPFLLLLSGVVPGIFMLDQPCCGVKTVKGSGSLAGTYLLSKDDPEGKPAECMDQCVYEREDDQSYYCFKKGGGMMSECGADNMEITTSKPPVGGEVAKPEPGIPSNEKYCDSSSDHTMCKYQGPSAECAAKTEARAFSDAGRNLILDKHNELRRKVAKGEESGQPKASNMREMVWNEELAAIAQRWADQCTFGHDENRKKIDGTYVGQNAYIGLTSQKDDLAAIMGKMEKPAVAWYNEVTSPSFNPVNIKPFKFGYGGTGHYTQVVWAESEELGCGQVMYKDGSWYKNSVVCNYAKGGNMQGAAMYEKGEPCSGCSSGYSCKDSLCSKNPTN